MVKIDKINVIKFDWPSTELNDKVSRTKHDMLFCLSGYNLQHSLIL